MTINVSFERSWTVDEIEEYISNPNAEKFTSMSNELFLELAACAEYYATQYYYSDIEDVDIDEYDMNMSAAGSIASGISDNFYDELYDGYYEYYSVQTAAHLDEKRKNFFAKELKLKVPENAFIPLSALFESVD